MPSFFFSKVSTILNGMLDQSFKQRTIRKQQGVDLVNVVLQNWMKLESWWDKDSSPESKMAVLTLLAKVLQVLLCFSLMCNDCLLAVYFQQVCLC